MPRINGHPHPMTESNPDFDLTMNLLNEFRQKWVEEYAKANVDPVKYSRLSVVALTQLAACLGVDVGMTADQFINICRAQFAHHHQESPKFAP